MSGFAEELELLRELPDFERKDDAVATFERAAKATCDFFIKHTPTDGIPYWDTGAPSLYKLGDDYLDRPSDPDNDHEPIDSSAAAIGAQGLIRLGRYLGTDSADGERYFQAGLTVVSNLLDAPYLSTDPEHQGLILHSIYHCPGGWDHIPEGSKIPKGESSMWGDYHAREVALLVGRLANGSDYRYFDASRPKS